MPRSAESAGCVGGFWLHTWGDGPRRVKKAPPTRAVGISQETAPAEPPARTLVDNGD